MEARGDTDVQIVRFSTCPELTKIQGADVDWVRLCYWFVALTDRASHTGNVPRTKVQTQRLTALSSFPEWWRMSSRQTTAKAFAGCSR